MGAYHSELKSLSESECHQLLKVSNFGHLGFELKGKITVLPINFLFSNGFVYSHSLEGSKLEAMRKHPEVCLQTETADSLIHWKSVLLWGHFEECRGDEASTIMRELIKSMNITHEKFGGSSLEVDFSALLERSVIYKIKIQKIVGRSEGFKE